MLTIAPAGAVDAQDKQERFAASADEFRNSCASCHGADGWGACFLTRLFRGVGPCDLTQLIKNNDGSRRSTMDELATASVAAGRVLVFSALGRSYLDHTASEPVAPGGLPETNL